MDDGGRGSWRDLLAAGRRGTVAVLCGGVLLFAVDTYVTASLLPSAVAEIGGEPFYAWVTTVYLLTAVVSSALVSRLLARWPARRAYVLALAAFGLGTTVDAIASDMAVLLVGRALQGVGGGLLAGLAYGLIRVALPQRLWTRASASISAMWGVGLLVGPVLGGVFAELGHWRLAFVALVLGTVAVAAGVPAGLRRSARAPTVVPGPFPLLSVLLVAGASVVLSVSGLAVSGDGVTARGIALAAGGLVVAVALLAALVVVERRAGGSGARILPAATFHRGGRLAALYLTMAVMMSAAAVEAFVPLFGQRLGGLAPLTAGFLGVCLASGWVVTEMVSASVGRARACATAGPVVVVAGFVVLTATQQADAGTGLVLTWVVALIAAGAGVGMAWPHMSAAAMSPGTGGEDPEDDAEGERASAAITMVQMLAFAVGASYSGVAVALGSDPAGSARLLYGGLGLIALVGGVTAVRARGAV
ncbi:MFS transporter [Actinomycetospora sp. TBRC 11914]|uniref:MFS transporter n=1 Tax=Actinomycetospora sp. TBRC 11914 TaxID=2729387 RepID=UPI00145EF6B2|nr:MFS transporter [Actinomycetospora sp. TBRC 11914]NMO93637.1 MFS transporter [Actinomycetospora sp. TBRC 11914]